MTQGTAPAWGGQAWETLHALVGTDGSAAHPYVAALAGPGLARRDLADAVHALCSVHGTHPGLADAALTRAGAGLVGSWLDEVAAGFARERHQLARLLAAAGPLPSTPGQAATDAAWASQRHAFQMLARSDRGGCAAGAVAALLLDWAAVRRVLARAADAFGVQLAPPALPLAEETATVVAVAADTNAAERALAFGAQQLLAQHRGLWSLLQSRRAARVDS